METRCSRLRFEFESGIRVVSQKSVSVLLVAQPVPAIHCTPIHCTPLCRVSKFPSGCALALCINCHTGSIVTGVSPVVHRYSPWRQFLPVSVNKNTPPENNTHWKIGFQITKSGPGLQFLLLDCRPRACSKGVISSQTPVAHVDRRVYVELRCAARPHNIHMCVYIYI